MIDRPLADITCADIGRLKEAGMPEGQRIEYKRELPGSSNEEKREFLADVSAFANAEGGDIIYGVGEEGGTINELLGLAIANFDAEKQRLENLIHNGLTPRVRATIKTVTDSSCTFLIIRIEKSWIRPHRVTQNGHDKFYARASASKFQLDVDQLRSAFVESAAVQERLRNYRADRLFDVSGDRAPVALRDTPTVVIHIVPLASFADHQELDIATMRGILKKHSFWDSNVIPPPDITFDGVLVKGDEDENGKAISYAHFYRSGQVEAVENDMLVAHPNGSDMHYIPHTKLEREVQRVVRNCFDALIALGIQGPAVIGLSLLRVRGLWMARPNHPFENRGRPIREESLVLPFAMIEDFSASLTPILKSLFDRVWNACGFLKSENFDDAGKWRERSY